MFFFLLQITQVLVQLQDQTENRVTKQNLKTVGHKVTENQTRYTWHCQFHSPTFLTPTISASTIVFVTYAIQVTNKNLCAFVPNKTVVKATLPQTPLQRTHYRINRFVLAVSLRNIGSLNVFRRLLLSTSVLVF